jgi:hypothetical protein
MRTIALSGAALVLMAASVSSASTQVLTAEKCAAPGFTPVAPEHPELVQQLARMGQYVFEARRPQPNYPSWGVTDPHIKLLCAWSPNQIAELTVQMILQEPQDPADDRVSMKTEPAGKQGFRGGVLLVTRRTEVSIGLGTVPDRITYDGRWYGATSGGLLTIEVNNVLGSQEAIPGWIDQVIGRITTTSP